MDATRMQQEFSGDSSRPERGSSSSSMKSSDARIIGYVELAIGAAVSAIAIYAMEQLRPDAVRTIASALSSIAASMIGFVVAAVAIVWSARDKTLLANMQKTGHYHDLVDELCYSVVLYLISMVVSVAALFLTDAWVFAITAIALGSGIFGTVLFISSGYKFYLVLHYLD